MDRPHSMSANCLLQAMLILLLTHTYTVHVKSLYNHHYLVQVFVLISRQEYF